ncbi:MAG TPA: GNAT family N-acetyltransferase [Vicinamibacterales bacterium]|jgi:RimJ/RimL family protein N-acetyltransferase
MANIQLVRLDPAIEHTLTDHPEYMKALIQDDWARVADLVHRLIGRTLVAIPVSVDELQWGGYFVVDEHTHEVVGSCAFKSPPTEDGTVEIAYFTYPGFEGRGYATGMASKLIELASCSPDVRQVIAHTLPETNASTRILERVGMTFMGEVNDPADGRVWRWQVALPSRRR